MPTISRIRHQRGEAADCAGEGAKHAKLGAGVAIVCVERIADEAAVTGTPAKQRDLALELLGSRRDERDSQPDGRIADDEPGCEIIRAVDDEVVA